MQVDYTQADLTVSASDAMKTLSTQLLAGKGPDILVMDGLPLGSYVEKSILLDLNATIGDLPETLLENILAPLYAEDGGLYAVPTRFMVPILLGEEALLSRITDMESLRLVAQEEIAKENPLRYGLGGLSGDNERNVYEILLSVSYPTWMKAGQVDREKIQTFFETVRELSDPESSTQDSTVGFAALEWGFEHSALAAGNAVGFRDFAYCTAAIEKRGDGRVTLLPGQASGVFLPQQMLGINRNSENLALAQEFVKTALSTPVQSNYLEDGFPVNEAAFLQSLISPGATFEEKGALMLSRKDGTREKLPMRWPSPEKTKEYEQLLRSVHTPLLMEEQTRELLLEEYREYIRGNRTLDEITQSITQKLQLMLTE